MGFPDLKIESVWIVVSGMQRQAGECPKPLYVAAVACDGVDPVQAGKPKLMTFRTPPYPTGRYALIVSFDAIDVAHCHLTLGWPLPSRIIDLGVEFRRLVNGRVIPFGAGLTGALAWFGLPFVPYTREQISPHAGLRSLEAVRRLYWAMSPGMDFARAVFRGRTLIAVAKIERAGIPADRITAQDLAQDWPRLR